MLKLIDYFATKAKTNRVFIIPTFLGIKLLIVNIILLSMGLIYANNYLILFTFIFFCLFIISMFYTHFNLYGIELSHIDFSDGFANDSHDVQFRFTTPTRQTYPAIFANFKVGQSLIKLGPFTIDENGNTTVHKFKALKRGKFKITRYSFETLFPLNLFKAFCYFNYPKEIIVYPELSNVTSSGKSSRAYDRNEDFHFDIRDYIKGDKLNRIAWKKSREDNLKTKVEVNDDGTAILFTLENLSKDKIEAELSAIASAIKNCHDQSIPYGLVTPKHNIRPSSPNVNHFKKVMRVLAEYES